MERGFFLLMISNLALLLVIFRVTVASTAVKGLKIQLLGAISLSHCPCTYLLTIASVTAVPDAPEWLVPDDCHVGRGVSVSLGARGLDSGTVHHLLHLRLKAVGNVKVVVFVYAHHGEALCPHHLETGNTQLLNNNNNKTDVQYSHVHSHSWNLSWTGGVQFLLL